MGESSMIRIQVHGGTVEDHNRHLCGGCRYYQAMMSERTERRFCAKWRTEIRSKVNSCTTFMSKHDDIPGTNYRDAMRLVNVSGHGPRFFTPAEWSVYEDSGVVPDRFRKRPRIGGAK